MEFQPIGIIHSSYKEKTGVPIQGSLSDDSKGWIELSAEYKEGLKDLDGFSHIILVYEFHLSKGYSLMVTPFLDDKEHGVFATRAPRRPNPIGMSIVRLDRIQDNILHIGEVDVIDGTPLLDIKPYVADFDRRDAAKGWIKDIKPNHVADDRFD